MSSKKTNPKFEEETKKLQTEEKPQIEEKSQIEEKAKTLAVKKLEVKVPRRNRKPIPQDIKLTARQYVRAKRYRWDRTIGFLLEMKLKFGASAKKVRPEWKQLWDAFWKRPV